MALVINSAQCSSYRCMPQLLMRQQGSLSESQAIHVRAGEAGLAMLNNRLARSALLPGEDCPIADIAVFGYAHVAYGAGPSLVDHPNVKRSTGVVEATSDFVSRGDVWREADAVASEG